MNDNLVKKKLHLRQESYLNQGKMDGTFPSMSASIQLDRVGSFKKGDRGTVGSSMMSAASSND